MKKIICGIILVLLIVFICFRILPKSNGTDSSGSSVDEIVDTNDGNTDKIEYNSSGEDSQPEVVEEPFHEMEIDENSEIEIEIEENQGVGGM